MATQKTAFIANIWICGLDENMNKIIGRTVYSNNKEMANYLSEDGTLGIMEYGKIQNIYKIEPDFQKEKYLKKKLKRKNISHLITLKNLLGELKIEMNKN